MWLDRGASAVASRGAPNARNAAFGSRAMIVISARALGSISVRPCSQFCNVASSTWMAAANCRCVMPRRLRIAAGEMMSATSMGSS
jgi:hypothetical protein